MNKVAEIKEDAKYSKIAVKNQILNYSNKYQGTNLAIIPKANTDIAIMYKQKKEKRKKESYNKKNKKIKYIILSIVVTISVIAGIIFANYLYINNKMYLDANNTSIKNVKIKSYFGKIILQEKVVQALKINNKELQVEYKGNLINFPINAISKNMNINVKIENKKSDFTEIEGVDCIKISKGNYSSISIKLPEELANKKVVDIYLIKENNNLEIYKKAIEINNDKTVTIQNLEECNGYIITYVPIKNIIVEDGKNEVCISKNNATKLRVNYIPENATVKNIKYKIDKNEYITNNEDKLIGLKEGTKTIKIITENNEIEKEIKINIGNYITDINIENESISLLEGKSQKLKYSIMPKDAVNSEDLILETSNPNIAKIEDNKIVGMSDGECKITIKTISGAYIEKNISVNVYKVADLDVAKNIKDFTYINGVLIVNKTYGLPYTYNPGLNPETKNAFEQLKADAKKEGLRMVLSSGYRSYNDQYSLYKNYVAQRGQIAADTFSARPGFSEHQTGLALDVNAVSDVFEKTPECEWLAKNAHKYGFIIRYPKGKENITGYKYESWHIRYLGVDLATKVYESGLCLEEYLGITSKYSN